jgi:carbamoyltransferase
MAKKDYWVVGISASHNGAVCLLKGDEIVVAIQEERLSRIKRQKIFGAQHSLALDYCLEYAGITPADLSAVVITVQGRANSPMHDLSLSPRLEIKQYAIPTFTVSHHYAHALSAFATSGFKEAAVLVVDGIGSPYEDLSENEREAVKEQVQDGWEMLSLYQASDTRLTALEKHLIEGLDWLTHSDGKMAQFRSLGTIFAASADQIFGHGLDAGKVMGLAPYGQPTIPPSDFFDIIDGRFVFYDKVPARFQHHDRWPMRTNEYKDLACSAQVALEKALLYLVNRLYELYPSDNLCYAGGVALNSVANERIIRETPFKNVYIIPAAEDSGPAIGAAYYGLWMLTGKNARRKLLHDAVGREYQTSVIDTTIAEVPGVEVIENDDLLSEVVALLTQGKIIGWFQGRSELGPRALGQRSILCDARRPDGKVVLNSKVKHREAFRPFAPVILLEEAGNWFELEGVNFDSPYMLRVCKFREDKKQLVPAVVHVDDTGRLQTVTKEANGRFYDLIKRFYEMTDVPIILNTSFNVMGMPIVESPEDALLCMMSTGIDYCVVGERLVKKRSDILLGLDTTPSKPLPTHLANPLKTVPTRQISLESSETFQDYVGVYHHATGHLVVEFKNGSLVATYNEMSTTMEPVSEHIFRTTGPIFQNTLVTFKSSKKGAIDRVTIQLKRDFGPIMGEIADAGGNLGEVVFMRVPERRQFDQAFMQKALGRYYFAEKSIRVLKNDQDQWVVTAAAQPHYQLVPSKNNSFDLKNTPGYSIEFLLNDADLITTAVVTQPNGVFLLEKR